MNKHNLSVRELQEADIKAITDYWLTSEGAFLESMGVDLSKLPTKEQMSQMLLSQLSTPIEQKRSYCMIWELDEQPIGHCNTNPTVFGEEAFMHLHLWQQNTRKQGLGVELIQKTIPYFFNNLRIKKLYSEPYALNAAPNKALEKAGFTLEKEYTTIPGSINFEQPVKRWVLTQERFKQLYL
ncbi:GNAT family N-acetyltransferase [Pontibacter ruber]|uniref:GNAT family N-acetyltransferase n=1 Tax=Pontibacter ruber TaxID=1343895 RepID=A0ABW5CZZ4_9BACT|nr:GNAT family protein [Pontibacter ruber]